MVSPWGYGGGRWRYDEDILTGFPGRPGAILLESVFEAVHESLPGPRWQRLFRAYWSAYRSWFLSEGHRARPTYLRAYKALRTHMPELLPTYERLVGLAGGGDLAARFLTLYGPPAYVSGCSQAVWPGSPPLLVRNYDYSPHLFEGVILSSCWLKPVIATSDCLWGVLDGINGDGLAVSLTFGGSREVGEGFGMPLILRYILETCGNTDEAVAVLQRVPSHMAYNITAVDAQGRHATVYTGPNRSARVVDTLVTANHQETVEWTQHARATATLDRERALLRRLRDCPSGEQLVHGFLQAPVYSTAYRRGFGTLYTAVYQPQARAVEFRWPNASWRQTFGAFQEGVRRVAFPEIARSA